MVKYEYRIPVSIDILYFMAFGVLGPGQTLFNKYPAIILILDLDQILF